MDEQGDYPIKVLDKAPLIMVSLPTVSSFFSTCGFFHRGGRSPSGDLPPLPLACGWPPGANGSLLVEWRRLQGFRVEDPSGARKGEANRPPEWAGPAAPSLLWVLRWLCTLPPPLAWFWQCYICVQDGGSLRLKFGLLRFNPRGCSS
jgi:hypothetical protein